MHEETAVIEFADGSRRSGILLGLDGRYHWDRHVRLQVTDPMPSIARLHNVADQVHTHPLSIPHKDRDVIKKPVWQR